MRGEVEMFLVLENACVNVGCIGWKEVVCRRSERSLIRRKPHASQSQDSETEMNSCFGKGSQNSKYVTCRI